MLSHTTAAITECHCCGETKPCTVYVSEAESETGYVDEMALCDECDKGEL